MFEYLFPQPSFWRLWSPNPLLTSIHIQGPFITLYGRKTVGEELHFVLRELQGRVIHGDDFEHYTLHGRTSLPFWVENPHVHYTISGKSLEQGIIDLITAIFKREDPSIRQKDYNDTLAEIEEDRIAFGHKELPKSVKKSLAQYDTKSPFFLSQNSQSLIQDIFFKYREYCTRPTNERCCELIQMYSLAIITPFVPYLYDEVQNPELQKAEQLLQPLGEIEECFKKLQKEPLNTEILNKIQQLISEVNVDELVKLEMPESKHLIEGSTLDERLKFITTFVENLKKVPPISAFLSLSRISQIFYTIVSNPFLQYGLLALAAIIGFRRYIKLNYTPMQ